VDDADDEVRRKDELDMESSVSERIRSALAGNRILIFMKGTPSFPMCGFSAATIEVFNELGAPYQTVDVLKDPEIRDGIKQFSNWPTIPQVYIDGRFIGGCDIIREMHANGELAPLVRETLGAQA
jgi:monothiol glutaredoxin